MPTPATVGFQMYREAMAIPAGNLNYSASFPSLLTALW